MKSQETIHRMKFMMKLKSKITYLEKVLETIEDNFGDSFKPDIAIAIEEFDESNETLKFLNQLNTKKDIDDWVSKLTSRIVMRYDQMGVDEIIYDYIELG